MGQPRIRLSFPARAAQSVWNSLSGTFAKIRFKAGEKDHSIWIDIQNNAHRIMIASTPREALTQLGLLNTEVDQHFTGHLQRPALRNHLTQAIHWCGFLNACFQHLTGHAPVRNFTVEAKSAATSSLSQNITTLGWAQAKLKQRVMA